eukprot:CAMPEP_0184208178 /NCGR_PEP_ID=MMETSP0976-20121227/11473_1 /TAXON_ID=483370 /ORGANISM="non described non described, Strain CCMP2097" /LENGTH=49 /DNA_ID= /DNA_START= /DNA_END= /DNA_ORIENTATION=
MASASSQTMVARSGSLMRAARGHDEWAGRLSMELRSVVSDGASPLRYSS